MGQEGKTRVSRMLFKTLYLVQVSKKNVSKELAQKIHDKAAPFIKWLQEAEEETSEDDSDVDIEYDERAKISKLKEVETSEPANDVNENQKKKEESEEEEDDDMGFGLFD